MAPLFDVAQWNASMVHARYACWGLLCNFLVKTNIDTDDSRNDYMHEAVIDRKRQSIVKAYNDDIMDHVKYSALLALMKIEDKWVAVCCKSVVLVTVLC